MRAVGAPLLVQYWMPRLKAVEACDVGPPWILISSGGFSPGGSWKSCNAIAAENVIQGAGQLY